MHFRRSTLFLIKKKHSGIDLSRINSISMEGHNVFNPNDGSVMVHADEAKDDEKDDSRKRPFTICPKTTWLVSGFLLLRLVASDILFEMTLLDQEFDLILQLGALLRCVSDVFRVRAIFFFCVWPIPYRVGAAYIRLIAYGVHDLFFANC